MFIFASMHYTHKLKSFYDLNVAELYELLRLRSDIFVVEQNCVFLDQDNKDQQCHHLLLFAEDKLAGYARIVPPGLSYQETSIGRVVTSRNARGKGWGRKLMELAIEACEDLYGRKPIRIGAQCYAIKFYESLGFKTAGEIYDEDGIDHIEMLHSL